ncbi:MAG: hypothetical protein LBV08_10530 [Clostridiales bacterium]|jgi:vacuolar-type H+-ATPase subunit E/Vma4|nr:hypothetical protein [Clostridiales bacterium]
MDIEIKLKKFSSIVFDEAKKEQREILEKIAEESKITYNDFYNTNKRKYDMLYEEEKGRYEREAQKEAVLAQSGMKRELIAIRENQVGKIFNNINRRIREFMKTEAYVNFLIDNINKNKTPGSEIIYLVAGDMKHKELIEKNTGLTCVEGQPGFIGGFKLSIGGNRILDYSFESKVDAAKQGFNKIRAMQAEGA